ncbi:hypothetical protein C1A50_0029 [Paenibacillus polymyxa]|nr:hypothetical protein C1A50_0029 [Paenibacillus polymyxa]
MGIVGIVNIRKEKILSNDDTYIILNGERSLIYYDEIHWYCKKS